ncbi:MAG: zinc-ribbon domain-containing protein [Thermoplasmata archaeon]
MPVCLHCGTLGEDGALFCSKCGFTLPQVDAAAPPLARAAPPVSVVAPGTAPPMVRVTSPASAAYPVAPGIDASGFTGPIAPPPSGKYCIRCRTIISRAAVYCPVCQQPQTP